MIFEEPENRVITIPKYQLCFVYFLLKNKEVVYVGQTKNGLIRPLSHRDKEFDEIKIIYCSELDLDINEDLFIQKYKPIYNKQRNYAVVWSLLRVRNQIRKHFLIPNYTIPRLKKVLNQLDIVPFIDEYTGASCITFDEYRKVFEFFKGQIQKD